MAKTKEERYIISVYKTATALGDIYAVLDRYKIGAGIGFNPKSTDGICRGLAQANFIKVLGKNEIKLSPNGLELVKTLTS